MEGELEPIIKQYTEQREDAEHFCDFVICKGIVESLIVENQNLAL
ncbi:sulfite reductase beta subunit-like hemoprotein [Catalinimonas alkaloidigena]|nr:hypothetical protein [Catalinimonas alkaloidigena]MDF9801349.1 sulfite reductase beta subunit-like hemoprotein [Catalinimonas alkaloidigena]